MTRVCGRILLAALALSAGAGEASAQGGSSTGAFLPDWLSVRGSVRARYAHLDGQFRPTIADPDHALQFRTLVHVEARTGRFVFGVEMQDSRAYATAPDGFVSRIIVNTFEPLQAYVGVNFRGRGGSEVDITLGRMTMDLGGRRLIARNRFRNTIQNFTGLQVHWRDGVASSIRAFVVSPVAILPQGREAQRNNETRFDEERFDRLLWGVFYRHGSLFARTAFELYLFGLHDAGRTLDVLTAERDLYTPGFRVLRVAEQGKWDFELETALQFGTRGASPLAPAAEQQPVRARFHLLQLGYTIRAPWAPRVGLLFDYATGNPAGTDRYERFDTLFGPRRAEYGPTGIYGPLARRNLVSPALRLNARPSSRLQLQGTWRAAWLEEPTDVLGATLLRDPTGASGRFAGHFLDVRGRYWLVPSRLRLEAGVAAILRGRFLREVPGGPDRNTFYVYTDAELSF